MLAKLNVRVVLGWYVGGVCPSCPAPGCPMIGPQSHGGGLDGLGEGASDIPGFLSEQSAEPGRAWGGNASSDKFLEM